MTHYHYPLFLQHTLARKSVDDSLSAFFMLPERFLNGKIHGVENDIIASVHLFGGETMYRTKERKEALRKFF